MTQAPTAPPEPDPQDAQDAAQGDETPQADAEPVETPDEDPQAAQDGEGENLADVVDKAIDEAEAGGTFAVTPASMVGDAIGDFEIHRNPNPDARPTFIVFHPPTGVGIPTSSDTAAAEIAHVLADRSDDSGNPWPIADL
jgi:hypothetical protein